MTYSDGFKFGIGFLVSVVIGSAVAVLVTKVIKKFKNRGR